MVDINLNEADEAIIEELREGRNLAANIARETGYDRQYISDRLGRLREHKIVENLGAGLYELQEDELPEGA
jgi:DNA-binding IclR family transcriptional regulator